MTTGDETEGHDFDWLDSRTACPVCDDDSCPACRDDGRRNSGRPA